MTRRRNEEDLGEIELPPGVSARVAAAVAQAEMDLEAGRVNFRWGKVQVELVKRAAELVGVPYQTYIKLVVYRQAVEDLKDSHSALRRRDFSPIYAPSGARRDASHVTC